MVAILNLSYLVFYIESFSVYERVYVLKTRSVLIFVLGFFICLDRVAVLGKLKIEIAVNKKDLGSLLKA